MIKEQRITVVQYAADMARKDWQPPVLAMSVATFIAELATELTPLGISLVFAEEPGVTIPINSYADLLNTIRIRSNQPGLTNLCLGHVIGSSQNLDLLEDIRRGVNRVAFAPETIEPSGSDKVVCHNCGCGC